MENEKVAPMEKQTLESSPVKKPYAAPQLTEQGTWTQQTGPGVGGSIG